MGNRSNAPFADAPQSAWETTRWDASALTAAKNAALTQSGGGASRRRGSGPGSAANARSAGHAAIPEEARAKRGKAKPAPPSTPEDVIHKRRDRIDQKRTIRGFLFKAVVIAALFYLLLTYAFGFAAMKGEQMYPRIRDGDLMLYYRLEDAYSIGDVVTFTRNGTRYTGRVVAKAGDSVEIDEAGQLLVNGNIQSEEIFYPTTLPENGGIPYPLKVTDNHLFLLCDMRTAATDSRAYGCVSMDELDGKIITILRRRGI